MKTSEIRSALRRRWPATLAVVVLAVVIAVAVHGQLKTAAKGTATTQLLVDSPRSALVNVNVNSTGLTSQASVLAQAMTSQVVLQDVAKAAGVPVGSVSAQGPFNGAGEVLDIPTPSEARSQQVVSIQSQYHVAFVAQPDVPIITATVLGPTPSAAAHVADSVLPGAEAWLKTIAATTTLPSDRQLVLRQLGDAQAGAVNSRTSEEVAIVAAIAVIIFGLLAVALVDRRLLEREELRLRISDLDLEQVFERNGEHSTAPSEDPYDQITTFPEGSADDFDAEASPDGNGAGELAVAGAAVRSGARRPARAKKHGRNR